MTSLAIGGSPWAHETFTIVLLSGSDSRVDDGEFVALRSINGYYVVAEGGRRRHRQLQSNRHWRLGDLADLASLIMTGGELMRPDRLALQTNGAPALGGRGDEHSSVLTSAKGPPGAGGTPRRDRAKS